MYYNSNRVSNDYYNSYKKEVLKIQDERKKENRKRLLNALFYLLVLLLILLTSFYLYKHYNPKNEDSLSLLHSNELVKENTPLPKIILREEELPLSIQLRESNMQSPLNIQHNATDTQQQRDTTSIHKKDVELIVKIIMNKMNKTIKEESFEK